MSEVPAPRVRDGLFPIYGEWHLDTNEPVISLNCGTHGDAYWIPLDLHYFKSALGLLEAIGHFAEKLRFSSECIGDLVRSLDWLLDIDKNVRGKPESDAEMVAVLRVARHALPCEGLGGRFSGVEIFESVTGKPTAHERSVLAERKATGRFVLGARGQAILTAYKSDRVRREETP